MSAWETVQGVQCMDSIIRACNTIATPKEQRVVTCGAPDAEHKIQQANEDGWLLNAVIPFGGKTTLVFERRKEY